MPDVRVPQRFRGGLEFLATLGPAERERLLSVLDDAKPFSSADTLARAIGSALESDEERSGQVLASLLSLISQLPIFDASSEEVAESIAASPDLLIEEEANRGEFGQFLARLIQVEAVATSAKAADVVSEHEHFFTDARILTDIRPVFGNDEADTEARGAVILSTLKIDHYTDGRKSSLYVALDEDGLVHLRDTVQRALEKTNNLRGLVSSIGLPLFRTAEYDDDA